MDHFRAALAACVNVGKWPLTLAGRKPFDYDSGMPTPETLLAGLFVLGIGAAGAFLIRHVFRRGLTEKHLGRMPLFKLIGYSALATFGPWVLDQFFSDDPRPLVVTATVFLLFATVATTVWLSGFAVGNRKRSRDPRNIQSL
ncbi:MAG: hypothetical protein H6920_03070 [Sphingomonadaceae bacterium]|nr:hypothetical protein [Sphingomonadaceae bacterium]MCP5390594.1 hypothetical protein [Sphingomonadaceae bacterium]